MRWLPSGYHFFFRFKIDMLLRKVQDQIFKDSGGNVYRIIDGPRINEALGVADNIYECVPLLDIEDVAIVSADEERDAKHRQAGQRSRRFLSNKKKALRRCIPEKMARNRREQLPGVSGSNHTTAL